MNRNTAGGVPGSTETWPLRPGGQFHVVLLGNMPAGAAIETASFVVNSLPSPALPLKVSWCTTPGGTRAVDDQLITLLVFALPQLETVFYRDAGIIYKDQQTTLPIQITNLSRKSVVLGNMTVSTDSGDLQNNTSLVGSLDPGGYFTLDVMYTPHTEGPAKVNVSISHR